MSISSISGLSQTSAPQPIDPSSTRSSACSDSTSGASTSTSVSKMGQMMSKLQDLEQTDPTKAKQVLGQIAAKLKDAASSAGDTTEASHLDDLAAKFTTAADTGDLSALQPHKGAGAPSDASSPHSKTHAYKAHAHHGGMSQVQDILDQALDGVDTSAD